MLLPAYEEYVTKLTERARRHGAQVNARLLEALGYIYSDLIEFCLSAFRLLSKRETSDYTLFRHI